MEGSERSATRREQAEREVRESPSAGRREAAPAWRRILHLS